MRSSGSSLEHLVRVHKALGSAFRLRILAMLADGDLCVCQITAALRLAPSTVSAHLSELKDAGLVHEQKEGRWVRYRLATSPEIERLFAALPRDFRTDARIEEDRGLLRELRKIPLETLCRAGLDLRKLGIQPRSISGGRGAGGRGRTSPRARRG